MQLCSFPHLRPKKRSDRRLARFWSTWVTWTEKDVCGSKPADFGSNPGDFGLTYLARSFAANGGRGLLGKWLFCDFNASQ